MTLFRNVKSSLLRSSRDKCYSENGASERAERLHSVIPGLLKFIESEINLKPGGYAAILDGSYAYGQPSSQSGVDILVVYSGAPYRRYSAALLDYSFDIFTQDTLAVRKDVESNRHSRFTDLLANGRLLTPEAPDITGLLSSAQEAYFAGPTISKAEAGIMQETLRAYKLNIPACLMYGREVANFSITVSL